MKVTNARKRVPKMAIWACLCLLVFGVACLIVKLISREAVTYISGSDYLYDTAIDYLRQSHFNRGIDSQKEDYQIFFDYKGFGISQYDDTKYAYMCVSMVSYYVEDDGFGGKRLNESTSSWRVPHKVIFINDKVVGYDVPPGGSYLAPSVREMFPDDIENEVLRCELDNANLENIVEEHYSYINETKIDR